MMQSECNTFNPLMKKYKAIWTTHKMCLYLHRIKISGLGKLHLGGLFPSSLSPLYYLTPTEAEKVISLQPKGAWSKQQVQK